MTQQESRLNPKTEFFAGFITWALVSGFAVYFGGVFHGFLSWQLLLVSLCALVFILLFTGLEKWERGRELPYVAYVSQWLCAAIILMLVPFYFTAILLVILAAELAARLRLGVCIALLPVLALPLWFAIAIVWENNWGSAFATTLLFSTFNLFAMLMMHRAISEENARRDLAAVHAQLLTNQNLLLAATQQTERLNIARELHDVLGHHLTALSLQLQIAERKVGDKPGGQAVNQAQQLAKQLLSDVRQVVSDIRDNGALDVGVLAHELCDNFPLKRITLTVEPEVQTDSVAKAETLLAVIREVLTNAARHSPDHPLTIVMRRSGSWFEVYTHQPGVKLPLLPEGNGLRGMRERLEEQGGELYLSTEKGLELSAKVPV
ncbi:sensor histidine kinase [Aliidiomarina indica]|uniref:sensor histidine kinase n=1 Tax=Aliidiomarina indica TaxID=2749147 RepID=UPI00188F22A4|nr:histidine kinase [Aliidiomarina indica]